MLAEATAMKRTPVPDRMDSLQCLRGLAALGVMLSHISQVEKLRFVDKMPSGLGLGAYGVDLFFVLSGFVIIHSLARRSSGPREMGAFFVNRFGRIMPAYWAVLIPCALVAALLGPSWITDASQAPWLQTTFLLPASDPPLVHPAWSLVHELYFYCVLGLLLLAPRRFMIPALVVWGVAMVGVQIALKGVVKDPILHLGANPLNLDFLLGAAIRFALPWIRPCWPRLQSLACGALLLVGAAALSLMKNAGNVGEWERVLLVGLPAAGLIWGASGWSPTHAPRVWALLRGLGDRSYVLYLCHFPICMVLGAWMMTTGRQGWGSIALYVALAFGCTAVATELLHWLVERPALDLAHLTAKRIARSAPRSAEPAPTSLSQSA
jgi:exopolysaccharide production protein ExoZ